MSVQQTTDEDEAQSAPTDSDAPATSIAKDDAFHILQNSRRRAVLRYLLAREAGERFRMRDVAEAVAAWEHGTTVAQLTSDERQRVYIALYQSHLPKLDDHGVIRYNQSRGVIEPTDLIDVFDRFLAHGLHAETDALTATDDAGDTAEEAEDGFTEVNGGLTSTVGGLFKR